MRRRMWAALLLASLSLTGCRVSGTVGPAAFTTTDPSLLRIVSLPGSTATLAFSPDGSHLAGIDDHGAVCVSAASGPASPACVRASGQAAISVAFSPDGRRLAIGSGLFGAGAGAVTILDLSTGVSSPVPGIPGVTARAGDSSDTPYRTGLAYLAMTWNTTTGHLELVNQLRTDTMAVARVVDVDPETMLARPTGDLALSGQGFSNYLAAAGATVAGGVYLSQQVPADLVLSDLTSGARTDLGVVAAGSQVWPLAVKPDGSMVLVGNRQGGVAGAPVLVSVPDGHRTLLPGAVSDVDLAAFSPDGRLLATIGDHRLLIRRVDQLSAGRTMATVTGPIDPHGTLSWDKTGVIAITGSEQAMGAAAWHVSG